MNSNMKLKIKKLHKDAKIPTQAKQYDSGLDIYSVDEVVIEVNQMIPVHTGISIQLPKPVEINIFPEEVGVNYRQLFIWECQVRPKSGLAMKHGLTVLNTPGTIDSLYRGEIIVLLKNLGNKPCHVKKGQKIAQLVIAPIINPKVVEVEKLDETERGDGGFGSTGLI